MGVKYLSNEARGFLYNLFHQSGNFYNSKGPQLADNQAQQKASTLGKAFRGAAFDARMGNLTELNTRIQDLILQVNDADVAPIKRDVELVQELMYRAQVENNAQLKADLGTYSTSIF